MRNKRIKFSFSIENVKFERKRLSLNHLSHEEGQKLDHLPEIFGHKAECNVNYRRTQGTNKNSSNYSE